MNRELTVLRRFAIVCLILFLVTLGTATMIQAGEMEIPSLKEVYEPYFEIGAAVSAGVLNRYDELLQKHFSSLTAENSMKFSEVHRNPGRYTFHAADRIVEYAQSHNMLMRGHTLIWHSQVPAHVFLDDDLERVDREVLLERMQEHIQLMMDRYGDAVYAWDVVNEAISDEPGEYLRTNSRWYEIIGEDYVAQAFRMAHEADPEAKLFYNDYSAVQPAKRDKIIRLIKELQADGVPIHGVGLQGHWSLYDPSVETIRRALEMYAELGIEIHITELDLSVYAWNTRAPMMWEPSEEILKLQAKRYGEIFALFREFSDVITNVSFWGVADDHTWLDNFPVPNRKNWPLLFDEFLEPKPAFWSVVDF